MKRFLVLSLCTVLFLIPCFAESIDFPEGYILNANIFSVKGNALSESQISVHIMTVEDPTVKLISQSLSGCSFLKLTGVEYGNEVYTVLLAKTLSAADETVALYCFAVAQTLIQNGFCSGVNVLIDGACPALDGIPLNTVYGSFLGKLDIASLLEQHSVSRHATLYLPDTNGKYISPIIVSLPHREASPSVILSLYETASYDDSVFSWLPREYDINNAIRLAQDYDRSGRLVLEIRCDDTLLLEEALETVSFETWQLLTSVCYSVTTNCPGVERVRLLYGGNQVASVSTYTGAVIPLENGEMSRLTFSGRLGIIRTGYEINESGTLAATAFTLPSQALNDPVQILNVCVPGISSGDILDAYVSGQEAYVCLSENFYDKTSGFSLSQAHETYYALVNTLCANLTLKRVKFLCDHSPAGILPCGLSLEGFLYPDPGLGR